MVCWETWGRNPEKSCHVLISCNLITPKHPNTSSERCFRYVFSAQIPNLRRWPWMFRVYESSKWALMLTLPNQQLQSAGLSSDTLTGWCSTLTLLLICSSFSRESDHPLLICSSLSTAQLRNQWVFTPVLCGLSMFEGIHSDRYGWPKHNQIIC